jgi:hypothetical protein
MAKSEATASTFQPWHFYVVATMLAATGAVLVARETRLENLLLISAAIFAVGLVAFTLHQTLFPLVTSEAPEGRAATGSRARAALEREKTLVLRSIKELEFDRAMGKIAETDFQEMAGRLRARAIGLMKQLDESPTDWRGEIEQELRRRLASRGTARVPAAAPAKRAVADGVACASCGTVNDADARFCKSCGTKLGSG